MVRNDKIFAAVIFRLMRLGGGVSRYQKGGVQLPVPPSSK